MEYEEIKKKLVGHKGQFTNAVFMSRVPTLKSAKNVVVEKRTTCVVRSGIDYKKLTSVQNAITNGTRGPVESLPWGEWFDTPYGVAHNGNKYIRLYPPSNAQLNTFDFDAKVVFLADGKVISRETAVEYCGSKAQARDSVPAVITVNCVNVVSIG